MNSPSNAQTDKIEKVQREGGMTQTMFDKMQEATRNAGRGELISWELVDTRTTAEKTATCQARRN